MKISKVVLTAMFAVLATVQCANSQTDPNVVTCNDYDDQFADEIHVRDGDRLTFTCENCSCSEEYNWRIGNRHLNVHKIDKGPYYYNVTRVELLTHTDNCDIEFQMTAVFSDVHQVIHLPKDNSIENCCTYKISSGNTTAHYIILVEETTTRTSNPPTTPSESDGEPTKLTTQATADTDELYRNCSQSSVTIGATVCECHTCGIKPIAATDWTYPLLILLMILSVCLNVLILIAICFHWRCTHHQKGGPTNEVISCHVDRNEAQCHICDNNNAEAEESPQQEAKVQEAKDQEAEDQEASHSSD